MLICHWHSLKPLICSIVLLYQHGVPKLILRPMELRATTNISKLDSTLDDHCSTGSWKAQTPDWNVNLLKGLLIKERYHLSLYKESGSSYTFARPKDYTCRKSGILKRWYLYRGCTRGKIRLKMTPQNKKGRHVLSKLLR